MTGFLDGGVAAAVALGLNLFLLGRFRRQLGQDAVFVGRLYGWTLLIRCAVALVLNMAVGEGWPIAEAFWGDSSTYDGGGYLLSLSWSGELVGRPSRFSSVSGYGFFHFVGAVYYFFGRNQP